MSAPVITVENLSKRYVIGHQRDSSDGLRHAFENAIRNPFRWFAERKKQSRSTHEEFWALKDVGFEINRGDAVGIIGRNGAGKSTLLKILSRITEPTSGRITMDGRVASLLEVGTGFHQELTGRENIFLNGAILGMSKAEIKRKFDEIVAFSEVDKFLDTPVKRYSSGMYVRLAFAVAAHLEPEILICDEVLAVGDAQFQKKCLGKMQDVSRGGRTVLFVSHNMAAVSKLCQRCVLLEAGTVKLVDATDKVIPEYLKGAKQSDGIRTWEENGENDSRLKICAVRIVSPDGAVTGHVDIRKPFSVEIEYRILKTLNSFRFGIRFITPDGTIAFSTSDCMTEIYETKPHTPGAYVATCFVPGNLLNEGFYSLMLCADIPFQEQIFLDESAIGFSVEQTNALTTRFPEKWPGVVCPELRWQIKESVRRI
jgi:lipopolysaccharide transport system ATP-binding protein